MESVYDQVLRFKKKYPNTVAWRLKEHAKVIEMHLNPGEVVNYAFPAQHNTKSSELFETCVVAITNKRLLIGHKRLLFGYYLTSITPDMYNDLEVVSNLFWGSIVIDTVKETLYLTNLSKKSLPEVETNVTSFMMEAKQRYMDSD